MPEVSYHISHPFSGKRKARPEKREYDVRSQLYGAMEEFDEGSFWIFNSFYNSWMYDL